MVDDSKVDEVDVRIGMMSLRIRERFSMLLGFEDDSSFDVLRLFGIVLILINFTILSLHNNNIN